MSMFEYVAIAYSLIISFSVMRIVSGMSGALEKERRYWVHTVSLVWVLGSCLVVFWTYWQFESVEWKFASVVLAIANPTLLYVMATIIMPTDASGPTSWKDYYFSVHRRFFIAAISWIVAVNAANYAITGVPLIHPIRLMHGMILTTFLFGAVSRKPLVHGAVAAFNLLSLLAGMFTFLEDPGALFQFWERLFGSLGDSGPRLGSSLVLAASSRPLP